MKSHHYPLRQQIWEIVFGSLFLACVMAIVLPLLSPAPKLVTRPAPNFDPAKPPYIDNRLPTLVPYSKPSLRELDGYRRKGYDVPDYLTQEALARERAQALIEALEVVEARKAGKEVGR